MSEKSKIDLHEISAMASKFFNDMKVSIDEIIHGFKHRRTGSSTHTSRSETSKSTSHKAAATKSASAKAKVTKAKPKTRATTKTTAKKH